MFSRRTFLKLFGSVAALFAAPKLLPVQAATSLPKVPEWLPKGFIPLVGQIITKEEYPDLFNRDGKYIPPYWKAKKVTLPVEIKWPKDRDLATRAGFQDSLTNVPRPLDNRVFVTLMSTEPLKWSNGKLARPGFTTVLAVDESEFLRYYQKDMDSTQESFAWLRDYQLFPGNLKQTHWRLG